MRSGIAYVLTALGAFAVAMGILIHYYVAPRLLMAPTDIYQVTRMTTDGATYFDAGSLKSRTGAALTVTSTVRGDPGASRDDIAAWDLTTVIEDADRDHLVQITRQRVAFDRRTGQLTNCCGAAVDGDTSVQQKGIGPFWPLGGIEKRDYQLFDGATRRTWPARYQGQERINGTVLYRFAMHIPPTKLSGNTPALPGELLGRSKNSPAVPVDQYLENRSTYLIDPRTGIPVNVRTHVTTTLKPRSGPGALTVFDFTMGMSSKAQSDAIEQSNDAAAQMQLIRTTVPLVSVLVGLLLTSFGLLLKRRKRTPSRGTRRKDAADGTQVKPGEA